MAQGKPKIPVNWRIKNLDAGEIIEPQYPIDEQQGMAVTFGNQLAQQGRFGFESPIIQFIQGKTKTFTFETVLYNEYSLQDTALAFGDIEGGEAFPVQTGGGRASQLATEARRKFKKRLDQFETISKIDTKLGRPPICQLIYGARSSYSATVLVQDGDQQVVSLQNDGTPREVRISLTLIRYVPFSQSQIDPSKPAKESFLLVASAAEQSYEAIARRFYGQPLLGDRLRKRHAGSPLAPQVGDLVRVPDRAVILQEVVDPEAHMLSLDDEDAVTNFERILEARNARKLTVVA
jgi:hypothetical protein